MLIDFRFGNYRSFKDDANFSMQATKLKSRDSLMDDNAIFEVNGHRLLTSSAIYGANASGKSNVIKALYFMKDFILNSLTKYNVGDFIDTEPFALNVGSENMPSEFEMIFIASGIQYRYGFEVTKKTVIREWLYYIPTKKEVLLFCRDGQDIHIQQKAFKEGKGLQTKTRENALFLSVVAQFNGTISLDIILWFTRLQVITGIYALDSNILSINSFNSMTNKSDNKIVEFVKEFDTKIHDIFIKDEKLQTIHPIYSDNGNVTGYKTFDLFDDESEGTKKIFGLAYYLLNIIHKGGVLVIDEFDARLHPKITREIIKIFNSNKTNPTHAQFIVATHDTNLLDHNLLRRDQIWFVKKDRFENSSLYSLSDLKIRNDASFEQEYITGRYGATPYVNRVGFTIEDMHEEGVEYGKK